MWHIFLISLLLIFQFISCKRPILEPNHSKITWKQAKVLFKSGLVIGLGGAGQRGFIRLKSGKEYEIIDTNSLTEQQAEELLDWLKSNTPNWDTIDFAHGDPAGKPIPPHIQ